MQTVVWILRFLIVVVLVWFAVKNAQPITIHGLPGQAWEAPLVFILLVVFVGGVLIGLLAWVPTVVRQRREMGRLRKSVAQQGAPGMAPVASPEAEPPHGI
jgi:lipopolysaccharide assembly protein A